MAESSEEETDLPLSLSAKKRRYTKKSQISSDSDGGEPQTGSSKREVDGSKDRHDDLDGLGSEPSKTPCHLQTPRTSERLRRKRSKSFCVPSKEKVLEAISPGRILSSQKKIKALRPKKLVNNFLRERTSYVSRGEGCYDSDDSSMSDFINDDDDEDDYEDDSEESGSSDSNKKDSGICSTKRNVKLSKKKRLKGLSESNDEDNSDDEKKSAKKTPCNNATANASDSDENFVIRNKSNKRRKIIHCSDSDEDVNFCTSQEKILNSHKEDVDNDRENSGSDDSQNVGKNSSLNKASASLRPRSKRVQNLTQQHKDKNKKMFSTLLKKRQTAKLDLKERLETKQFSDSESDETSSSSLSCSEDECDPLQEAEAIFMHSSELEEDDDDRNFIDDDEQSSNEGMNSDCASQLLKLLDTFTGKLNNEDAKEFKTSSRDSDNTRFKRVRRRRKRNQRKVSQWRRIKIDDDSEDGDNVNNASDSNRHPPLHVAVLENNFDLVDKLIKEDSDCVYELGYRKRTALHLAALEERVDLVKLLLEHGADRTALDCYHLPAIAYAASGHPDSMRLLLDHASLKNISNSMNKNLQGMNLLHLAIGENRDGLECDNRARCLELLFSHDKKVCSKLLSERDARTFTPLAAGVYAGQHKCVQVLLKMGANALTFKTDDSGNLLHFAVECASHFKGAWECERDTSLCLRELLKSMKLLVNDADDHGFTPLMYACESGNAECVKVLLENGASVNCSDNHGTSGLHLAAISGDTQCVELLLNSGHQVDCVDRYGWPPLLYANFKAHESCVLALMKPKPEQVFILGGLLRRARNDLEKKRAVKVVKNVLVSLANHDAYYTVFNDFVRQNPEMLDENNYGLLQHTWRAILDFDNKRRWFLRKLSEIRGSSYNWLFESIHLDIDRENVLGSAINQMGKYLGHALRNRSLNVTFKDEPGICTGPKREFFACFCKDVIDPKRGLFDFADDAQYSPVPNAYFAKCIDKEMPLDSNQSKATAHQTPVTTGAKEEGQSGDRESELADEDVASVLSRDLTDEELLTVTQTGELSTVTANDRHGISSELADNQSMGSDGCRGQQETENIATCQPASEQAHLISSISREECMVVDQTIENDTHPCNMSQASQQTTWLSCMEPSSADQSVINLSLRSKLKQLRFVGRMIGFAVCQNLLLNLQLSKPFVKQILGIPLTHPDDLSSFDYELHRNAVIWVRENSVNELDLPFSVTALNPWNSKPATIELSSDADKKLTDDNKEEYVRLVSQLKLETLIRDEVTEFAGGLNEVIPRELLSLFTADEFSLLIGGVAKIDLDDWKKNTQYQECSSSDNEITWFWNVVSQLKEEEKALLMKFSTGSPCVPIGGFAALTGLLGPTKFTILKIGDLNKIPMASTCFNMLKLTSYSSEKHLKDKLLIAIRHGAEGFSFG